MRERPVVLALACLLAGCGHMPHDYKVKPFPYQGWTNDFPSGLKVVSYELSHMPEVMVSASYRVGAADDPPGKSGMSHLVEHLSFRAKPRGGPRIWDRVHALGVEFNGVSFEDSTEYYEVCPPEDLAAVLALEADRLRDPLAGVTEKEFLRERDVVLRELAQNWDPSSPGAQLEWLTALLVPGTPYAEIPTAESIGAISFADAKAFVKESYTPAHLMLVITGPHAARAVAQAVVGAFQDLTESSGPDVRPVPSQPPAVPLDRPAPREALARDAPVERPVLWVGWAVPGEKALPGPEAMLARRFLQNLITDVQLSVSFRGKLGTVTTRVKRMEGASIVAARIELLRAEDGPKVLEAIRSEERHRSGLGGVEVWESVGMREPLLMQAHLSLDALELLQVASFIRTTGHVDYIGDWPRLVVSTLDDVDGLRAYAARYLTDQRLAGLLVVPSAKDGPVPLTSPGGSIVLAGGDHHGTPDLDIPPGDPLKVAPIPELAAVQRRKLGNGTELVVAPRDGFRAVSLGFYARGEPSGFGEQWLRDWALGASSCPAPSRVDDTRISFVLRDPADLIADDLRTFPCRDVVPRPDAPLFDRLKRYYLEFFEKFDPTPDDRARAAMLAALFPKHPYGDDVLVTADRVRSYSGSDAARFMKQSIRPERSTVVISGYVEATPENMAVLADRFGSWTASGDPATTTLPPPELPPARRVLVADRPGWRTAQIVLAVRGPTRARRDEPAFRALAWKLHHDLNASLRVTMASTYGVSVSVLERELAAALLLSTVVPAERVTGTLGELFAKLEGFADPMDERSLAQARWQVAREFGQSFGTTARNRDRLGELALFGLPSDEWDTFIARTASLTPERVAAQARAFATSREIVLVAGPARTLVPALKGRGLEPELLPEAPAPR